MKIHSLTRKLPAWCVPAVLFFLCASVWLGIVPQLATIRAMQADIVSAQELISSIKPLVARIASAQAVNTPTLSAQAPLLTLLEQTAREHKIFGRLTRVSPVNIQTGSGRSVEGATLDFSKTTLPALTPFLQAVVEKGLVINEITLTRTSGGIEGELTARLTLVRN